MNTKNSASLVSRGWASIVTYLRGANDNQPAENILTKLGQEICSDINAGETNADTLPWLIAVCISSGIDQRDMIIRFLRRFTTYTPRHIGWQLGQLTGSDPEAHLCMKDEAGRYHLLPAHKPTSS